MLMFTGASTLFGLDILLDSTELCTVLNTLNCNYTVLFLYIVINYAHCRGDSLFTVFIITDILEGGKVKKHWFSQHFGTFKAIKKLLGK